MTTLQPDSIDNITISNNYDNEVYSGTHQLCNRT